MLLYIQGSGVAAPVVASFCSIKPNPGARPRHLADPASQ